MEMMEPRPTLANTQLERSAIVLDTSSVLKIRPGWIWALPPTHKLKTLLKGQR